MSRYQFYYLSGAQQEHLRRVRERKVPPKTRCHLADPITTMQLSVRAVNCLHSVGIQTIADLVQCTERRLRGIRSFGKKCFGEVTYALAARGLQLAKEGVVQP